MNFGKLKDIVEHIGDGSLEKSGERRDILKSLGMKAAVLTLPLVGSSLFNKANAQTTNNVISTLNNMLKIERLTFNFFQTALEKDKIIPAHLAPMFKKMQDDDYQHMELIKYFIDSLTGIIDAEPSGYDFTGGKGIAAGPFNEVFKSFWTFLEVAQVLKDLSVRAYGGMLPGLMPKNDIMYNGTNIYTVEARHAAFIRLMRVDEGVKPWVTGNKSGMDNPGGTPFYANDESVSQAGINIVNINGYDVDTDAATEAFDEPMVTAYAMPLFNNFIVP